LKLYYNGISFGDRFVAKADKIYLDSYGQRVKLSIPNLRLMADRENKIKAVYRRSASSLPVVAEFMPPQCSAFERGRHLASVTEFQAPHDYVQLINTHASQKNLNPNFVAALIAQESGFDPLAVSWGKAIGLTQITTAGESEILKSNTTWPRYPGLHELSLPLLKFSIINRRINAGNEWRLDPAKSIQGGVEYLDYLNGYWNKDEKRKLIAEKLGSDSDTNVSEIILASYNAGPKKVTQALDHYGKNWLEDDEMAGSVKYVRKIVSYCDQFSSERQ
jgi:soluble lytic murein transglycosylase-like protein